MKAREAPTLQELLIQEAANLRVRLVSLELALKNPKPRADFEVAEYWIRLMADDITMALETVQDNSAEALKGLID